MKRDQRIDRGMLFIGGVVATSAMTVFLYVFYPGWRQSLPVLPEHLQSLVGRHWLLGVLLHYALGSVVFPMLLVVLRNFLPGSLPVKGMILGFCLWIVAEAIVLPLAGGGFFHAGFGGVQGALVFLLAHLLYGLALGAIARSTIPGRARGQSSLE